MSEGSPSSGSRRIFTIDAPPDRAAEVASALRQLVRQQPRHSALVPIVDAGVDGGRTYVDLAPAPGEALDAALDHYGPADIGDAIPRLRQIADALDAAAHAHFWHGALTPAHLIVSADTTAVAGIGVPATLQHLGLACHAAEPYRAPETHDGRPSVPASDQFALAAIAHEWLFGRAIAGPDEPALLPALPGVDLAIIRSALGRALARNPAQRFSGCRAFVEALAAAVRDEPVRPAPAATITAAALDDLPIYPGAPAEAVVAPAEPFAAALATPAAGGAGWGRLAAVLAGAVALGATLSWLAAGQLRRPRAVVAEEGRAFTEAPIAGGIAAADAPSSRPPAPAPPDPAPSSRDVSPAARDAAAARASQEPRSGTEVDAARAVQADAGLLVHSTPPGASVSIDGVERGVTPVAVRGLPLGVRTVVVAHPGFRLSERQVTLTAERPSRALEVTLAAVVPVAQASPIARDGSLVVDSRPAGASVVIDGRPVGVTPLTLPAVAAGNYRVRIERAGYRTVETTVAVSAGQPARVAVRLEGGQDEE